MAETLTALPREPAGTMERTLLAGRSLVGLVLSCPRWQRAHGDRLNDRLSPAIAIVVFGAAVDAHGPSAALRARVQRAAELHAAGWAPMIIYSGLAEELDAMRCLLLDRGLPMEALAAQPARSTRETVAAVTAMVGRGPTVIVVTSPYHLRRVREEARRHGLRAIGCASRIRKPPPTLGARIRARAFLARSEIHELVALWLYRLRWWLAAALRR